MAARNARPKAKVRRVQPPVAGPVRGSLGTEHISAAPSRGHQALAGSRMAGNSEQAALGSEGLASVGGKRISFPVTDVAEKLKGTFVNFGSETIESKLIARYPRRLFLCR